MFHGRTVFVKLSYKCWIIIGIKEVGVWYALVCAESFERLQSWYGLQCQLSWGWELPQERPLVFQHWLHNELRNPEQKTQICAVQKEPWLKALPAVLQGTTIDVFGSRLVRFEHRCCRLDLCAAVKALCWFMHCNRMSCETYLNCSLAVRVAVLAECADFINCTCL